MKKRRLLSLALALLMTAAVLTGCGASAGGMAYDMATNEMAPAAPAEKFEMEEAGIYSSSTADSTVQQNSVDQKLITKVYINAETEELDGFLEAIGEKITNLGGYVEYQDVYNGSSHASYRYRSATLTIRIPAENVNQFVEQIKGSSNVISYSRSQEDVTLSYVAIESRIAALETEQTRLLELMEQAQNMSDLLEIEGRLTDVRGELESVTRQLLVLSNQVNYATVELNVDQVKVYTEVEEQTVWQRIGSGFKKNLKNIGEELVDFFVWVVTYSPQLIFWAVVITLAVVLLKRKLRRKKISKAPIEKNDATE